MISAVALAALLAGCAYAPAAPLSPGSGWVADGKAWAAAARAVYEEAAAHIARVSADRPAASWAVVLDVDETTLNNVGYQVGRERLRAGHTPENWAAWTREEAATLVPGAATFIEAVNEAGGHVALVSNRRDREQLATERNLAALALERGEDFRVLLTRASPDGPGEKDARFALVPELLAVQGYPDVEVVAFVGDNVDDKPAEPAPRASSASTREPCTVAPAPARGRRRGPRGVSAAGHGHSLLVQAYDSTRLPCPSMISSPSSLANGPGGH